MNLHYTICRTMVLAFLLFGAVTLSSCAQEDPVEGFPSEQSNSLYSVSPTAALNNLTRFTADGSATRMADRTVRDMTTLRRSDLGASPRAVGTEEDDALAYIVNFEGGGYAVLGADARQGGVVALTESGTMDIATLAEAKAACDRDIRTATIADYINGSVARHLLDAADGKIPATPVQDASSSKIGIIEYDPIKPPKPIVSSPLMCTKWHQGAPYNTHCFTDDVPKRQAVVGCVALALAQIIIYNHKTHGVGPDRLFKPFGSPSTPMMLFSLWPTLDKAIATPAPDYSCQYTLARFIGEIGIDINMKYGTNESTANILYAVNFLSNVVGYKNVALIFPKVSDIEFIINIAHLPVLVCTGAGNQAGEAIPGANHAWVLDGFKRVVHYLPDFSNGQYHQITITQEYVYHKLGIPDVPDGWYIYNEVIDNTIYSIVRIIDYELAK